MGSGGSSTRTAGKNRRKIPRHSNTSHTTNDSTRPSSVITQLQYLSAHSAPVLCLTKIDDERFASASADNLILIWSHITGKLLDVLEGHSSQITQLLYIQYCENQWLISGSNDNTLRIWDINEYEPIPSNTNSINDQMGAQCICILNAHQNPITKILIYPLNDENGNEFEFGLISVCNDSKIALWKYNIHQLYFQPKNGTQDTFDTQLNINHSDGKEKENVIEIIEDSEEKQNEMFIFSRFIDLNSRKNRRRKIQSSKFLIITEMKLFVNTLIIGCSSGALILVNMKRNDRKSYLHKHKSSISYINQLSMDCFITASFDGLIVIWRMDVHSPQALARINDTTPVGTFGKKINDGNKNAIMNILSFVQNCFLNYFLILKYFVI